MFGGRECGAAATSASGSALVKLLRGDARTLFHLRPRVKAGHRETSVEMIRINDAPPDASNAKGDVKRFGYESFGYNRKIG